MERKVNISEICNRFYQFALNEHREDLFQILQSPSNATKHFPVYVNFLTLSESCAVVADLLRSNGSQVLPALDQALTRAARHLYSEAADQAHAGLTFKPHLHARLIELPICSELHRTCVPRIEDEAQLLCVSGTVVRAGLPHLLETAATYSCNKCAHRFTVTAEYAQSYQTERPARCPNPRPCRAGAGFSVVTAGDTDTRASRARDYQEIRLQEQVQKLDVGKIPRGLCVVLEDDLVDSCKSGDDVIITGTVRQRWRSAVRGCRPDIEMTLHANRVFVNSERRASLLLTEARRAAFARFWRRHLHAPLHGRNTILRSFCSQIYGMYVVKLAVALTVVGGVRQISGTSSTRGEPHLLLIGDPGTGKSQLLKYAARLCPRSVLTTGTGSTSAGLTCAAVKEGPEWQLEAGALVLADGGVCCIDEFNSIREVDKTSIHEAMEQQTISVAKAGMVCKLSTRCSILAAANPKRPVQWDAGSEELLSQLGLGTPLISRFDLILVLKDARSEAWDKRVSSYILAGLDPLKALDHSPGGDRWSLETLQAYLAHVRTIRPQPEPAAVILLQAYYQRVRSSEAVGRSRTTVRLLESLLRLTQAHARLRCSQTATLCDAITAVTLMEASLGGLGGGLLGPDGVGHILHTAFPDDPRMEYRAQCELILRRLGLDAMLEAELRALDQSERLAAEDHCSDSDSEDEPSLYVNAGVSAARRHAVRPAENEVSRSPAAAGTAQRTDADASVVEPSGAESLASKLSRRRGNGVHQENQLSVDAALAEDSTVLVSRSLTPGSQAQSLLRECNDSAGKGGTSGDSASRLAMRSDPSIQSEYALSCTGELRATTTAIDKDTSLTHLRPAASNTCGRGRDAMEVEESVRADVERPIAADLAKFRFVRTPTKKLASEDKRTGSGAVSTGLAVFNTSLDSLMMDLDENDFESSLRDRTNRIEVPRSHTKSCTSPKKVTKSSAKTPRGGSRLATKSNCAENKTARSVTCTDSASVNSSDPHATSASIVGRPAATLHSYTPAGEVGMTPERSASGRRALSATTLTKLMRFSADADDAGPAEEPAVQSRPEPGTAREVAADGSKAAGGSGAEPTAEDLLDFEDELNLDFEWPSAKRTKL